MPWANHGLRFVRQRPVIRGPFFMAYPSSYKPEYVELARNYCLLGSTSVELARFLKVNPRTLDAWRKKYPEFEEAMLEGKAAADERVTKALFHRACGYSHPEDHITNFKGEITVTPTIKHYAPDTTACIYWLKNRRPDLWHDRVEITGKNGDAIEVAEVPTDQLARRAAFLIAQAATNQAAKTSKEQVDATERQG